MSLFIFGLFREAVDIRATLSIDSGQLDLSNDSHTSFLHLLRNLYKSVILTDLDFALDKKVEQDLWNVCFKSPISSLQPSRGKKNPLFNWFLEGSAGFYMVLLQEISARKPDADSICKSNIQLGIFNSLAGYAVQPKSESFLYMCQHCLIHLGDLARYRNLLGQAEGFYQQAVQLEPSGGHPYNQLALLESARGDTLATLYYYVRSVALRHPFPPARINLDTLFKKQLAVPGLPDLSNVSLLRGRLGADEFLAAVVKLLAQIGSQCQLDQAEAAVRLVRSTCPSLVATESLNAGQLIRILAVDFYLISELLGGGRDSVATDGQKRSGQLAVELASAIYGACLTATCSLPDQQLAVSGYLPVVKLVLDWCHAQPLDVLDRMGKGQIWPATAKLLNQLQLSFDKPLDCLEAEEDDGGRPLPEDVQLMDFSPLRAVSRWPSPQVVAGDHDRIRARRIVGRGKTLDKCFAFQRQETDGSSQLIFTSLRPDSPAAPSPVPSATAGIESKPAEPAKEIKILARPTPPPQRNVALTAILKNQPTADDDNPPLPLKQVSFQPELAPPLPPVKPASGHYPRPSLPPRLERLKAEQQKLERQYSNPFDSGQGPPPAAMYSTFGGAATSAGGNLPDLSLPPPGLGFPPPPPAAWAMAGHLPPPPSSYSLFNPAGTGGNWPSTPMATTGHFPTANLVSDHQPAKMMGQSTSSLWSGPGPSPLERLLQQQKLAKK